MWFNVFINMTTMSNTPSSNDNQRVIVVKGRRGRLQSVKSCSAVRTVVTS